ncbi:hypothetical protein Mapa_007416 [Marchantia paleacea]|nr:hypothetical protein Mapa_007416 [Marchantia paleacea]
MEQAAVTIQASFRGFYVRKCQPLRKLRQIADVRTKLKKLNTRACDPVYIDRLCIDPMENRKMKEEIMALLLELDSVQGVLPVVRKFRKSVARDVVQFQEIVDAVKVDSAARNDAEELVSRPSAQATSRASEQANPRGNDQVSSRASAPVNPPLRRVMSLDNNVYPEQSYAHQLNKKKTSLDGGGFDGYNRSSDEDAAPRRRPDGTVRSPFLGRSVSGNHKLFASRSPLLGRTISEVQRNASVRSPLLGRSISEVVKKSTNRSPLLGRSISEVQRKKGDIDSPPVTTIPDALRHSQPKTPPISDERASAVDLNPRPACRKSFSFDRQKAAVLIQSTYRGHLSRRSRPLQHLRNILVVNRRLAELNNELVDPICAERLRNDGMERLKWSEEITALLLKLDSVQGVVQAIRDIRKSVTREVIKLQEKVDNIIHEAEVLSRMADIHSDSSVESTEHFNCTAHIPTLSEMPVPDQEILKNVGELGLSSKASARSSAIQGSGGVPVLRPLGDSPLWDDKFMDLQKPQKLEQDCDLSTGSCSGERATTEVELQPEQARVQRNLKRVQSGSVESRRTMEFHQGDVMNLGRSPAEDDRPLTVSSSESAASMQGNGKPQPLVHKGEVDSQHASLAGIQKKLKRVQSGTLIGAVDPQLYSSVAGIPDQMLTRNSNGFVLKPVKTILDGISQAVRAPNTSVHRTRVHMRSSDDSSPSPRQAETDSDSNDVPMLPDMDFLVDRVQQGCYNGRSSNGLHLSEERACEFLRSQPGHCEELETANDEVSHGQSVQEVNLPTTSEAPAVHSSSEDQWEDDRVTDLMIENTRLKLLLSKVLEQAEQTVQDLKATKIRLAKLEKERAQHVKRDETGVRKKTPYNRRRR